MEKSINKIIGEYVERKDVNGLAEYFRAYIGDEIEEKEKSLEKISEAIWKKNNIDMSNAENIFKAIIQSEITADNIPEIVNSTIRRCQETIKEFNY